MSPMNSLEKVRQKRDVILRVAAQFGAHRVRIFGSVARGEAGPESDVDILVEMERGRSLLDLVGLEQDLHDLLGCRVDVVVEGGINPLIAERILKEAVAL